MAIHSPPPPPPTHPKKEEIYTYIYVRIKLHIFWWSRFGNLLCAPPPPPPPTHLSICQGMLQSWYRSNINLIKFILIKHPSFWPIKAQWRYHNQWGLSEAWLLLVETDHAYYQFTIKPNNPLDSNYDDVMRKLVHVFKVQQIFSRMTLVPWKNAAVYNGDDHINYY